MANDEIDALKEQVGELLVRRLGILRKSAAELLDGDVVSNRTDQARLDAALKGLEGEQEQVRNRRQIDQSAFQRFDQESNQYYNLLSQVIKTLNEMRAGTIRGML